MLPEDLVQYLQAKGYEPARFRPGKSGTDVMAEYFPASENRQPWLVVRRTDEEGISDLASELARRAAFHAVPFHLMVQESGWKWYAAGNGGLRPLGTAPRPPRSPLGVPFTIPTDFFFVLHDLAVGLTPDRVAEFDWSHLLAILVERLVNPDSSIDDLNAWSDRVGECSRNLFQRLGGGTPWVGHRLSEGLRRAVGGLARFSLHNSPPEILSQGLDRFIGQRLAAKQGYFGSLSEEVARYVVSVIPEPIGGRLYSFRCGTGEITGASTYTLDDPCPWKEIDIYDDRLTLAQISALRLVLTAGSAEILDKCDFRNTMPSSPRPKYDLGLVNLVDPNPPAWYGQARSDWQLQALQDCLSLVIDEGWLVVLVPDVYLNGDTYQTHRRALAGSLDVRLILKLPHDALTAGVAGISLLYCKRARTRSGAADLYLMSVLKRDLGQAHQPDLAKLRQAVKDQSDDDGAWVERVPDGERLDPPYYAIQRLVRGEATGDTFPWVQLPKVAFAIKSGHGGTVAHREGGKHLMIPAGAIRDHCIERNECSHIEFGQMSKAPLALVPGDVLVTSRGTLGRTAVVSEEFSNAVPGENVIVVRPGPLIDPHFLAVVIESDLGKQLLTSKAKGSVIDYLTLKDMHELYVPLPPLEYQQAIAREYRFMAQAAREHRQMASDLEEQIRRLPDRRLGFVQGQ